MALNEADTRAKLIDPAIHGRGWTEDTISREETAGTIAIIGGKARRQSAGRIDYMLRVRVIGTIQPVAVAVIEAKAENLSPAFGLEQAKGYCRRMNVPFAFSSNGKQYVEYDQSTGQTQPPRLLADFPTPDHLRTRYEQAKGFHLSDPAAKPLLMPYRGGESSRRYYQDAAIRGALEKIAREETAGRPKGHGPRVLLSLATGSGKTFIAVNLLRRIADAGQLRKALFICDRDELRTQASAAFQLSFGADAAVVSGKDAQKNARVLIATYQTLDIDSDEANANFLTDNYPPNYFSHIVIDECHRSGFGKWRQVLDRNAGAVQIGLTATPRQLDVSDTAQITATPEMQADERLLADNVRYFGEPVYEYDISQGIEDGYLAACEIIRRDIFLDKHIETEREHGIGKNDLTNKRLRDAITGETLSPEEANAYYEAPSFEARLVMPDRVVAMCADLFEQLRDTSGPEQKTIVFCASDAHAGTTAAELNNLYAVWCARNGKHRADPYAFKCTSASNGGQYLADLRGASRSHFIATTVDLLTTGVDIPALRNIVFFKYVKSPISFYQMIGRGTRIDVPTNKLMFRLYDYTSASRLFGAAFKTRIQAQKELNGEMLDDQLDHPYERIIQVEGFQVHVTDAGRFILTKIDGKSMPVTIEEYRQRLTAKLVEQASDLDTFRLCWIEPSERLTLLNRLPDSGKSASLIRRLDNLDDCDLYDVLAELGYEQAPQTRTERAAAFTNKNVTWLSGLSTAAAGTIRAIADQFAQEGIDGLENQRVFETPSVARAGGLNAIKAMGNPSDILHETKARMFAA